MFTYKVSCHLICNNKKSINLNSIFGCGLNPLFPLGRWFRDVDDFTGRIAGRSHLTSEVYIYDTTTAATMQSPRVRTDEQMKLQHFLEGLRLGKV